MRREADAIGEVVETLGKKASGKLVTHRAIGAVIESVRTFIIRSISAAECCWFSSATQQSPAAAQATDHV